jgi:hypothetical protein
LFLVDADDFGFAFSETPYSCFLCYNYRYGAIFAQEFNAFCRIGGIHRHISASGLEDCQHSNDHLQIASDAQANQYIRANSHGAQSARKLLCTLVEFTISDLFACVNNSDAGRRLTSARLKNGM